MPGLAAGRQLFLLLRTISPNKSRCQWFARPICAVAVEAPQSLPFRLRKHEKVLFELLTPREIWHRSNMLFQTNLLSSGVSHAKELTNETNCLFGGLLPGVVCVVERLPARSQYQSTNGCYQPLPRTS